MVGKNSLQGCSHTMKEIVKVGTVEKEKEYLHCQHRRGKRPCQRTLYARFKHKHPTPDVATWHSEPGVPGPPEKRTLRRANKYLTQIQCPFCSMDLVAGTTFFFVCLWCNANKLGERSRAASTNVAPRRLCLHPSSYKARDARTTQQQYGKAKNHSPKGRYNRCQHWKHRREKEYSSIAERWDLDPICRESLRHEGRTRKDGEGILKPKPIQHTTAQRPNAKPFGAAGRWQTSTNRDAPEMSNRAQRAFSHCKFGRTERYRKKVVATSKHAQKRIGQDGAVPLFHLLDMEWRCHE